jgi:hypothetical protein
MQRRSNPASELEERSLNASSYSKSTRVRLFFFPQLSPPVLVASADPLNSTLASLSLDPSPAPSPLAPLYLSFPLPFPKSTEKRNARSSSVVHVSSGSGSGSNIEDDDCSGDSDGTASKTDLDTFEEDFIDADEEGQDAVDLASVMPRTSLYSSTRSIQSCPNLLALHSSASGTDSAPSCPFPPSPPLYAYSLVATFQHVQPMEMSFSIVVQWHVQLILEDPQTTKRLRHTGYFSNALDRVRGKMVDVRNSKITSQGLLVWVRLLLPSLLLFLLALPVRYPPVDRNAEDLPPDLLHTPVSALLPLPPSLPPSLPSSSPSLQSGQRTSNALSTATRSSTATVSKTTASPLATPVGCPTVPRLSS